MRAEVQRYYGEVLKSSADLRTTACCTTEALPGHVSAALGEIHEEVLARYYGCGLVVPELIEGARILDLGCGAGRDCYVLSRLAGPDGFVTGVDMTREQLEVARRHQAWHAERFGYMRSNVEFIEGDIEHLEDTGLASGSFDFIISNCVINLAADKPAVLRQAHRLLREGGEMYFADIYADRRIPAALQKDPVLYGECLAGALYWNDFIRIAKQAGFADPRLVADRPVTVDDPALVERLDGIRFFSATYRLGRLDGLEPACEDYGQAVRYRGTIAYQPDALAFDKHHVFETGKVVAVCGNTWRMLKDSRFEPHFEFFGDGARHRGIFPGCGAAVPFGHADAGEAAARPCC